jgi:DHA1 family tetracycline resistance protein-like MFS transporter
MTSRVEAGEQGRLQGAQGSLMGIASMTAPILFTEAFSAAVGPFRAWNLPGIPFLIDAVLLIGAFLVARRAVARSPRVASR